MSAVESPSSFTCQACGALNSASARHCIKCGAARSVTAQVDEVMADLAGANLLRSSTASASSPFGQPPARAGSRPFGTPPASTDFSVPAGATMQLPSIDDLRATGMLLAAADPAETAAPVDATAEYPAQRPTPGSQRWRPSTQLLRALPLAALCAMGAGLIMLSVTRTRSEVDAAQAVAPPTAGAAPSTVRVAALDATIGLTEDNKEAVLSLCFRASDNPNTECRRAHLEQLGEFPSQTVALPGLTADVFEVANAWYNACVDAGSCTARDVESCQYYTVRRRELGRAVPETLLAANRPAVCVTREQAQKYCEFRGMRLPTGTEWERLARAGTDRLQPWGNFWTPAILNWGERDMVGFPVAGRLDGHELTAPVDAFFDGRTTEGLHQFFGNAAEWTSDDGEGSGMGEIRGGSYADDARMFRATRVTEVRLDEARTTVGFRCVGDPL